MSRTSVIEPIRTVSSIRETLAELATPNLKVGFVPTMGAFHRGHESLIVAARAECDLVVVSIFVNPTQFNESQDFQSYPQDEIRDLKIATRCGADLVFIPSSEEIYPQGFCTSVNTSDLADVFEGVHRPGHFAGVCTIVLKLLNIVEPDIAFFGAKDAQQVAVVKKLVRDLNLDVEIKAFPTIRQENGLALSSRNQRLSDEQLQQASSLFRALTLLKDTLAKAGDIELARNAGLEVIRDAHLELDYLDLVDPLTFSPIRTYSTFSSKTTVLAIAAVRIGDVRLIDSLEFSFTPNIGVSPSTQRLESLHSDVSI